MRITRHTLARCKPTYLLRLAKWLQMDIEGYCDCLPCNAKLIDKLVRHLDETEMLLANAMRRLNGD